MSIEHNKQAARALFAHFSSGDTAAALALMHDDATWRLPGKPALMPSAGTYGKPQLAKLFGTMMGRLAGARLPMTVHTLTAEGERVAAEVTSRGELVNGR